MTDHIPDVIVDLRRRAALFLSAAEGLEKVISAIQGAGDAVAPVAPTPAVRRRVPKKTNARGKKALPLNRAASTQTTGTPCSGDGQYPCANGRNVTPADIPWSGKGRKAKRCLTCTKAYNSASAMARAKAATKPNGKPPAATPAAAKQPDATPAAAKQSDATPEYESVWDGRSPLT